MAYSVNKMHKNTNTKASADLTLSTTREIKKSIFREKYPKLFCLNNRRNNIRNNTSAENIHIFLLNIIMKENLVIEII